MSTSSIPLLLSLKPHYADLVFRGQKKVELRRRSLKQMQGRDVFVYSTTPVRMLRGGFRIGKVWTGTPEEIWPLVSDSVGVEKPELRRPGLMDRTSPPRNPARPCAARSPSNRTLERIMATKFAAATALTLTLKKARLSPDYRGGSCLTGNSPLSIPVPLRIRMRWRTSLICGGCPSDTGCCRLPAGLGWSLTTQVVFSRCSTP